MNELLAQRLLEDRARHAGRKRERRERLPGAELDPFEVTRWRVVAGGDLGYLPATPMRKGEVGFWIGCRACGQEFESKGMAYCEGCLVLPADERRAMRPAVTGRLCQAPNCENFIPREARKDARYCSQACQQRAKRARVTGIIPDSART